MSVFLILFAIAALLMSVTKSQLDLTAVCIQQQTSNACQARLLYPEMYYDYHACSTVFDWSRAVSESCQQQFLSYEVEVCNNYTKMKETVTKLNKVLSFIPGSCLANFDHSLCYARVRGQLSAGDPKLWSSDGYWTGLSNEYRTFQACVVEGHDICLPLQMCTGDSNRVPTPPLLIINQKWCSHINNTLFNITATKICFKQVTYNIHLIQMCSVTLPLLCGQPNEMAFIVIKSGWIEVTADHCSSCFDQCGLEPNRSLISQNHCVETNWGMLTKQPNSSLRNVCISSKPPQTIAATSATYYLQLTSPANRAPLSCQNFSDSKTQISKYPELSSAERERRGIILCDTAQRSENIMIDPNSFDTSKTQCKSKAMSNKDGVKCRSLVTCVQIRIMHFVVALSSLILAL